MRLLGLTDIHGSIGASILETASTVDCILAAGDITHFGGREEAAAVLDALRSTGKQILLVPGNCDTPEAIEYFDDLGINLHGRIVRFGGMAIAGIGGALPGPMATPNVFSDDEFQTMLAGMEEGIESGEPVIFVSHQPLGRPGSTGSWGSVTWEAKLSGLAGEDESPPVPLRAHP
jgi:Icc-related predicted phosphoesterase